jgi:uncharacterized MnhB-related membrane protein
MSWEPLFHSFLLLLLFVMSLIAIELKDLLYAIIILGGASVALAVLFYMLRAPDIAITEAVVGAGVATILYIVTISRTRREE